MFFFQKISYKIIKYKQSKIQNEDNHIKRKIKILLKSDDAEDMSLHMTKLQQLVACNIYWREVIM